MVCYQTGMSNLFELVGRSEPSDLTLGHTIWKIYTKELLSVWCLWLALNLVYYQLTPYGCENEVYFT